LLIEEVSVLPPLSLLFDPHHNMADEEKMASLTEKRESIVPATPEEEKKLVRKLDRAILPIACLLYLLACGFASLPSRSEAHPPK